MGAALAEESETIGVRGGGQNASQFAAISIKSCVATLRHFNGYRIRAQEITELVYSHD